MSLFQSTMLFDKCGSTPGSCGCSACSIYERRPFAKKIMGLVYNGTQQSYLGWIWKDETENQLSKMMAQSKITWDNCEKTEGYCGCDECNRYQVLAQQKGMEKQFVERFKPMDLDALHISFRWNYKGAEIALKV